MKKKYILTGILIIIVILAFFRWKTISNYHLLSMDTSKSTTQPTTLPKEIIVTLDKDGFSPNVVTINVGSAVRWKNVSGAQQTVNSDNYPTNQLHRDLNFGIFNNNSSFIYTFTQPGTYGYHNQFNHTQQGKVVVSK